MPSSSQVFCYHACVIMFGKVIRTQYRSRSFLNGGEGRKNVVGALKYVLRIFNTGNVHSDVVTYKIYWMANVLGSITHGGSLIATSLFWPFLDNSTIHNARNMIKRWYHLNVFKIPCFDHKLRYIWICDFDATKFLFFLFGNLNLSVNTYTKQNYII